MMKQIFLRIGIFIILLTILALPVLGLFHPGLPVTHDGQDHVARIANFYQNLQEGNLVPRWAGNLNWGYGHPILMFLYPMPSYLASIFHSFGFSFVDSTKIIFGLAFLLSGLAMYVWLREIGGNYVGLIGSLLYLFAPYRFVDLYVRGAIGEHMAFVFPPLVMYFLLKVSKDKNVWYFAGATVSLAGLILSHNAISIMFLPIIVLYMIYLLYFSITRQRLAILFVLILLLGFGLSTFFWLPAFLEGKYTLRDIVTSNDYSSRFVPISNFFTPGWSFGGTDLLSKQIGVLHWLFIITSLISLPIIFRKNKKIFILIVGLLFIFFVSLFIMTPYSAVIWNMISLLRKFQFPWRFLSVSVFATAAIGAFIVLFVAPKHRLILTIIVVLTLLFLDKDYWHANAYSYKPESFYASVYNGTTDTGESSPIWSIRFMEHRPKTHIEVISGKAQITEKKRTMTAHEYVVDAQEKTRLRENTLYFPGWKIYVDGRSIPIEFQDPSNRGIMTFWVDKGEHYIQVLFTETKLRQLADAISIISLLVLIGLGILVSINAKGSGTKRKTTRNAGKWQSIILSIPSRIGRG